MPEPPETTQIPPRFISSMVFLGLFLVFSIMAINPDGLLVKFIYRFVLGLFGKTAFFLSIPALLYLFSIHAFSHGRPVRMRSVCLIGFVLSVGCIFHLTKEIPDGIKGLEYWGWLYNGGITKDSEGLICGLIASLLRSLLNDWISLIFLIVAGIFMLLASMQITIPSLIRAFENRPRAEWETEEAIAQRPEPASVVVNHIANKRIEMIENRRRAKAERVNIDLPVDGEERPEKPMSPRVKHMMSQIDDIDGPVSAAKTPVAPDVDDTLFNASPVVEKKKPAAPKKKKEKEPPADIDFPKTSGMPPLEREIDEFEELPPVATEPAPAKVTAKEAAASAAEVAAEIAQNAANDKPIYCFPPIDLLNPSRRSSMDGTAEMRENTRRLNETLASFKIEAHIINVTRGPSVTRYEVELEKGVRLNKLTTVADDIALSLGASGVRIAAVTGKISVVGIEVPNRAVTTVSLREVIDSNEFNKAKSKSSFAVGKDIAGNCIVGNIAKLPHMLIAGTTGSGKSVCMNSIIISLLYKASPDDVKLIMVDPKMVELGIYNGIPHLLIPVVTDPKKAAGSLQWAVTEMMRRYKAMSDAGVRDLESYNSIVEAEEEGSKLPQVVVIIDELADLMLVAAKEVEESICRIAQMGRAAGIHLIIATQRPSADVITGLMKANIPSRIAFSVASAMESRIILDTQGAEKLVGRGDMLFAPIGAGKPLRVQGCFVSDPEVEAVANYVKDNYVTTYDQTVMEEIEKKASQTGSKTAAADVEPNSDELEGDEMLPAAVDVILETGQASVSMLQRRLKLGYARAARIVDEMEEKGIVGPFQGSKPRAILITKEKWEAMKNGGAVEDEPPFDDFVPEDF
ncbi:MAG: DNA translocase FtsK [Oscillospiraceae bacterium]|nr:DNA translocase FtsK [Oscillospiraceae bacterium]